MQRVLVTIILLMWANIGIALSNTATLEYTKAKFISEQSIINAQQPFWVSLELDLKEGWHTYWQNPGDSGMATQIDWELPNGFTASEIMWQPPERIPFSSQVVYGYHHTASHLVKITPPKEGFGQDNLTLTAHANWLVCKVDCIPEQASLRLNLPVGETAQKSEDAAVFNELKKTLTLRNLQSRVHQADGNLLLSVNKNDLTADSITSAYAFVAQAGVVEPSGPQSLQISNGTVNLTLPKGLISTPSSLSGFLSFETSQGTEYVRFDAPGVASSDVNIAKASTYGFITILLMAFIGGIILNAMPCVFPVLSIKALSLLQKVSKQRGHTLVHGLAYTFGILASFAAIAGLMLLLKASGQAIGWGFQMQNPLFIVFLIYLLFLVGLNLIGAFEIFLPMNVSDNGSTDTLKSSFGTGILATLVATPCTAPFMATAIGLAIALPWQKAMGVFLALGFGLAFPYLLLTMFPGLLRFLPKPGHWMVTLRQFLAFPMFLSVVWLLWVLMQQVDVNSMGITLLGLVFLSWFVWFFGKKPKRVWLRVVLTIALTAMVLYPFLHLSQCAYQPTAGSSSITQANIVDYNEDKLAELVSSDKPVFVYATAAWCITCKVNEKVALNTSAVQMAFAEQNIVQMKADWTQRNAKITEFLNAFERDGVPLYVYYPGKGQEPVVLPQLLTPNIVIDAIKPRG